MRKRDFLFAGLLSLAIPAFAQEPQDGPVLNPDKDAKVIFTQDFEADWDTWRNTPIGVIDTLEYYIHEGASNSASYTPWTEREKWQRGLFRTDSVITLYNGIKPTDNEDEIAAGNFAGDVFGTKLDVDNQERKDAMRTFGEADLGGDYILEYASDTCTVSNAQTYPGGYTANYRRNLFVRGLDIEDNTSYRLTFYVKAKNTRITSNNSPRMSAGVFRGYYKSEKPFSMGVESDAANYKYNTSFEYTKSDFNGEWEKVTYMTYYLNDSIANDFVFKDGYWWADDNSWTWAADAEGNTSGYDLNYIVQPDQFFVRLGFLSDFTTFQLDNLSLTKSTIAGAEYDRDKMRIDFGYKTNLADLANEAKAKTNIPAAEVKVDDAADWLKDSLGYEWRFEVWGLDKETDEWEEVIIRSAEYHDDGYMYLFTDGYELDGEWTPYLFGDYKKVLVTFHNPIDIPELTLKYTGDGSNLANAFPNALDIEWIKNGKIVPDFYNEIATPNPYVFTGVHSLADLPPVVQSYPYEEGSFGLKPQRSFSFKFSREVWIDESIKDGDALDNTDRAIAYVNNVPWKVSFDTNTDTLTITCPDDSWEKLSGDVVIEIKQIKSRGSSEYGENVVLNYHFGDFERNPQITVIAQSDWRGHLEDFSFGGSATSRPLPDNIYVHSGADKFVAGTGVVPSPSTKLGLYPLKDDTMTVAGVKIPDNCFFYLSSRNSSATGNLYSIEHLTPGSYVISFKFAGRSSTDYPMQFKFYAKPDGDLENGNENGFAKLEAVADKTVLEPGRKPASADMGEGGFSQAWKDGTETLSYTFKVASEGDYVFEWINTGSASYYGVSIGNYWITNAGDLSFSYTTALNASLEAAAARIALADADKARYTGADYNALSEKVEYYKIGGEFDALKETEPSVWDAAKKDVDDATKALELRMDTVDIYYTAEDKAKAKVTSLENQEGFKTMPTLAALAQLIADNASYDCTTKSGQEIVDAAAAYDDAVKAVDDRVAAINNFNTLLESIVALKDAADAQTGLDEYATMVDAYNSYKDTPIYTAEDEDFNTAYNGLIDGKNAYVFKVDYVIAKTRQVKELFALAEELDYDFADLGGKAEVKAIIDALVDDDPDLTSFLREAAKMQIYQKYADGEADALDSLDVSALMPNYFLYTEAQVGRDMEKNSSGNWRIMSGANTTAFPGWTFSRSSGNWIPTTVKVGAGEGYMDWEKDGHVFVAGLRCKSTTQGTLSTVVEGLPEAFYWVGLYGYNQTSNVTITFKTDSIETAPKLNDLNGGGKFNYKEVGMDSVLVVGNLSLNLSQTSSSSSEFDIRYFILRLRGMNPDADYDALLEAQQELLTIVDANKALEAGVEYFTVGGMKLDAPKAGQILIRKTTQNGKVVVDKVLIK